FGKLFQVGIKSNLCQIFLLIKLLMDDRNRIYTHLALFECFNSLPGIGIVGLKFQKSGYNGQIIFYAMMNFRKQNFLFLHRFFDFFLCLNTVCDIDIQSIYGNGFALYDNRYAINKRINKTSIFMLSFAHGLVCLS